MWGSLARIGGVLLVLLVLLVPTYDGLAPLDAPPDFATPSGARILDYRIEVDVDDEGDFQVGHALTVDVPAGFQGLSFTQTQTPEGANFRFVVDDVWARLDGADVEDPVWRDPELRQQRISVGSEQGLSEGEHRFEMGFRMRNAVGPAIETAWIPSPEPPLSEILSYPTGGWPWPINRLTLDYQLPGEAVSARCTMNDASPCRVDGAWTPHVTFSAQNLEPNARMHVMMGLSSADPGRERALWHPAADPVFGQRLEPAGRLLVLAAIAVMAGAFLGGRARQRQQVRPVYEPPNGVGPAQAALMVGVDLPAERAAYATVLLLQERGLLESTPDGFADVGTAAEWARIDPVSRAFGEALLAGTSLEESAQVLLTAAAQRNVEQGHLVRDRIVLAARFVLVPFAFVAALVLLVLNPQRMSLVGLPFALFAVYAAEVLRPGAGTRRTESGRVLWERTAGFRQVLSGATRVGLDREPHLYATWLPWAVAFGCADEWTQRYAEETSGAPVP